MTFPASQDCNFCPKSAKKLANGMLSEDVYHKIFRTVFDSDVGGNIVEIGTAHGAATIAMASGLKCSARSDHIYTVDRILGGSREKFGGIDENVRIINDNFERFDLQDHITLHVGTSQELYSSLPEGFLLSGIMIDADGAIDRDLSYFFNHIKPGGFIIIDDCNDEVYVRRNSGNIMIDQKHKLTSKLLNIYNSHGLFSDAVQVEDTFFAFKSKSINDPIDFKNIDVIQAYRELIFSNAQLHSSLAENIGNLTQSLPWLHKPLKSVYKNVFSR